MANISFPLCLGLLFGIQSWLYAQGQVRIIKKDALIGQQVNLTCYLNSTDVVTWFYSFTGNVFFDIYTCQYGHCIPTETGLSLGVNVYDSYKFQATRTNDTSVLSLTPSNEKEQNLKCELGNYFMRIFKVKPINQSKVILNCNVKSPSSNANGVGSMTLSCEVISAKLNVILTMEGIGLNFPDDFPQSSQSSKAKTLYFDDLNTVHNASCKAYFPDINITRSCTYPNIIKAQHTVEGQDIIVECDDESDVDHWRFYYPDGREEDIKNRSWSRKGGRSLLIRDISDRDVGKVVVCQIKGDLNHTYNGTIGFHVISEMSGDNNESNFEDPAPTPSASKPYLVLMMLFLSLWLITTVVCGVWLGCTPKMNKSGTFAIASASGNASVPNGDSDERETPLVNDGTGARGDPGTLNKNNSAHNPVFEPEVNSADENNWNRQSNNESHLYFTLEKSSPSPVNSLPRASTARWKHPDTNPASLNKSQSSHWQGYEIVGESNMGATCSYDLGEYAEVGYQIQGKGPPDLGEYSEVGGHFQGPPDLSGRPSIRKKPGREKVKENDISSLYSKVNK